MSDHNIQMKKRTGTIWDKLFPITKTKLVLDQLRGTTLDNVLTNLYERIAKVEKSQSEINVKDFGAVGDGVTDDTQAIQNAINSIKEKRSTLIFPATNGKHYSVSELTIPAEALVSSYVGIGDSRIYFTGRTAFHIKGEFQVFKNLSIWHKGNNHVGVRIFNDERDNTRLDFDLLAQGCNFAYADKVVSTWGRGVILDNCDFNDITGHFIYLSVKLESEIAVGYNNKLQNKVVQSLGFSYIGYLTDKQLNKPAQSSKPAQLIKGGLFR